MEKDLNNSLECIRNDGVILYPTDTIWGIGCNPFNLKVVEAIFALKQRPDEKRLILLVSDEEMLSNYVGDLNNELRSHLISHKRPLTIIYDNAKNLPEYLLGPNRSIAIRLIKEPFCNKLISLYGQAITSTSANISGEKIPTHFEEIHQGILKGVDYVVNLRRSESTQNKASDIAKYTDGKLVYIRKD